jgi:hypothetical protein
MTFSCTSKKNITNKTSSNRDTTCAYEDQETIDQYEAHNKVNFDLFRTHNNAIFSQLPRLLDQLQAYKISMLTFMYVGMWIWTYIVNQIQQFFS